MKTVLVINDNDKSCGVVNATRFAFFIAQKMQANLLVANVFKFNNILNEKVIIGHDGERQPGEHGADLCEYLDMLNALPNDFEPKVKEIDASAIDESQLAEVINENNIWMIVKEVAAPAPLAFNKENLNFDIILNKIHCPLLLVPGNWLLKTIERLAYIADLRYCRMQIVKYLIELAKAYHADLSIAHLAAAGIPDMDDSYANKLFDEEVRGNVHYDQLFFNNIREKDLTKSVDVLINGMHNDLLVMVKTRFHFNEIMGPYLNNTLPAHITIPLLIFPY